MSGDTPGAGGPELPSDAELLRAHVHGDSRAFERLVHRHSGRLFAVALRTLGDREEALDALQDALLSAHRAASSFRGDAKVSTWLHRIVVNACLDRARRSAVRAAVHLTESPDGGDGLESVPDPRDREAERDTAHDVEAALAQLPLEQRAAIVLVDLQGHGVDEAARILDCPVGTVKSRCARGRARLAVLLGHLDPAPPVPKAMEPERNRERARPVRGVVGSEPADSSGRGPTTRSPEVTRGEA